MHRFRRDLLLGLSGFVLLGSGCNLLLGIPDFTDAPAGVGGAGGDGGATPCEPGKTIACYEGPEETEGNGTCKPGTKTCLSDGSRYGDCVGQVLPAAGDDCAMMTDSTCDGAVTCACDPGTTMGCYEGPAETEGTGLCKGGTRTCAMDGSGFGACKGQVIPKAEDDCGTAEDDDCDGVMNELCTCMPGATIVCYSGKAGTEGVGSCKSGTQTCDANGTGYGSCVGEVVPAVEQCGVKGDEDCDGIACSDVVWAKAFTSDLSTDDMAFRTVAVDSSGSSLLTGIYAGATAFDGGPFLQTDGSYGYFFAKLDAMGKLMWAKELTNEGHGSVDASANSYLAYSSQGLIVTSFDPAGVTRWSKSYSCSGTLVAGPVFAGGGLVVGGVFTGSLQFSPNEPALVSPSGFSAFVAVFDPNSGAYIWSRALTGGSIGLAGLGRDVAGNVVVVGSFSNSITIGAKQHVASGASDVFLAKLSGANKGAPLWSHAFGAPGNDFAGAVAIDSSGAAFVGMTTSGTVDLGGGNVAAGGIVAKFSSVGAHIWSKSAAGTAVDGLAVDAVDDVVVAGGYVGSVDFGGGGLAGPNGGGAYLVKLANDGTYRWGKVFDSSSEARARLAVQPSTKNVFLGWWTQGVVDAGTGLLGTSGNESLLWAKFEP